MTTYQLDDLYRITGNNPAAVLRLLQIFVKDTPAQVDKLKQALQENDVHTIGEHLHKLIPKARHMGMGEVSDQMRNIKSNLDAGMAIDSTAIGGIIHTFEGLLEHIQQDIASLMRQ